MAVRFEATPARPARARGERPGGVQRGDGPGRALPLGPAGVGGPVAAGGGRQPPAAVGAAAVQPAAAAGGGDGDAGPRTAAFAAGRAAPSAGTDPGRDARRGEGAAAVHEAVGRLPQAGGADRLRVLPGGAAAGADAEAAVAAAAPGRPLAAAGR